MTIFYKDALLSNKEPVLDSKEPVLDSKEPVLNCKESVLDVQARIGVIALTDNTINNILLAIISSIKKMGVSITLASLTGITSDSIAPFLIAPEEGYLWILKIYRRGKEIIFEVGICPKCKMDKLEKITFDNFESKYKFSKWEIGQTEKRNRVTLGIALRDYSKEAMSTGIHLAYILNKPDENHISVMYKGQKRQYYFRSGRQTINNVKYNIEYHQMNKEEYDAVKTVLTVISSALLMNGDSGIATAIQYIQNSAFNYKPIFVL